jgi:preprotein translocase subunit YajC
VPDLVGGLGATILAADPAPATEPGHAGGGGGLLNTIAPFAIIFFIFYFLVIRPQGREKKKREDLLKALSKHDQVVTTAGLHGTVVSVTDTEVVLRVADDVRLTFDRTAIWQIRNRTGPTDAAPAAPEPEVVRKNAREPAKGKEKA